jgi:DNA polymerase III subunit epsilon
MSRQVVLDTETTGVEARNGDRIVEIGCVELINLCPTGRSFHVYLNPERAMSEGAFAVHGLSDSFLADKQRFADIAGDLVEFLSDSPIAIHNAPFDVGFLDMEFARIGMPRLASERIIDTLVMARRKHPGASNSLDALCGRYGIDTSRRVKHGALLDAEILSEVYIELLGGKQADFGLSAPTARSGSGRATSSPDYNGARPVRAGPLAKRLTDTEQAAHDAFVATLSGKAIWSDYQPATAPEA